MPIVHSYDLEGRNDHTIMNMVRLEIPDVAEKAL